MYALKVDGMTCGGCAASIKRALQQLDNSARVDVDLTDNTVSVDTHVPLEAVINAIKDAGYDIKSIA